MYEFKAATRHPLLLLNLCGVHQVLPRSEQGWVLVHPQIRRYVGHEIFRTNK